MSIPRTTCLVTGGAGFIGSHLVHRLLRDGHAVRVLDDFSTGARANLAAIANDVQIEAGDIRDPAACARVMPGVEVVFHVAALPSVPRSIADPWTSHDVNVNGTMRILEAMRAAGARRVVFSSSSSVYGDTPVLPKRESLEPLPRSPYATSKLAGEQYVLAYARAGMLEGGALRYFNVFGPRQSPDGAYAALIPKLLQAVQTGASLTVHGDGEQSRDFTYVDNVVEANLLAAFTPGGNHCVANCGAGHRLTLNDLLALTERVTGQPVPRTYGPTRTGDVRDSLACTERASALLGYTPLVNVEEGLRRTWAAWQG